MPELGDQPVQAEYHETMVAICETLDRFFNGDLQGRDRPTGFVLMVYPFDGFEKGDSRCNYMSNGANRKDVVTLMKEMIARFEGQPEQKGHA
jgi:hypothetical protein